MTFCLQEATSGEWQREWQLPLQEFAEIRCPFLAKRKRKKSVWSTALAYLPSRVIMRSSEEITENDLWSCESNTLKCTHTYSPVRSFDPTSQSWPVLKHQNHFIQWLHDLVQRFGVWCDIWPIRINIHNSCMFIIHLTILDTLIINNNCITILMWLFVQPTFWM